MPVTGLPQHTPAHDWLDLAALLDPAGGHAGPPPRRDEAAWRGLYRFATAHLVAPGLYAALAARGRLAWLPEPVCEALAALHLLNRARNAALRHILRDLTRRLNAVGLTPIVLKGAIALLPDQYPGAAARVLGDLDVALEPEQIPAAVAILRAAGYRLPAHTHPTVWRHEAAHHHAPPLMHPSGAGYVELHRALLAACVPSNALPLARVAAAATLLDWDGVQLRVPTLAHRLIHNSLHQQVQDDGYRCDRRELRQLLEFAQLRTLPAAHDLDWPRLLADLDAVGMGEALRVDLLATQRLFGLPLPPGVHPSPAALAVEGRFWLRQHHPRLDRWLHLGWRLRVLAPRLRALPRRLMTPSWYPATLLYLRHRWFPNRSGHG